MCRSLHHCESQRLLKNSSVKKRFAKRKSKYDCAGVQKFTESWLENRNSAGQIMLMIFAKTNESENNVAKYNEKEKLITLALEKYRNYKFQDSENTIEDIIDWLMTVLLTFQKNIFRDTLRNFDCLLLPICCLLAMFFFLFRQFRFYERLVYVHRAIVGLSLAYVG